MRNREGFNRLIADALEGKIDLILTKSLSRFARNTVDSLTTIRKLKAVGVAIYFEKENINTLDANGEFLITLMSSFAEEESRSISENITWSVRRRFAQGIYYLFNNYGYKQPKGKDAYIVEDEAKVVRFIYMLALTGKSGNYIAEILIFLLLNYSIDKTTRSRSIVHIPTSNSNARLETRSYLRLHKILKIRFLLS